MNVVNNHLVHSSIIRVQIISKKVTKFLILQKCEKKKIIIMKQTVCYGSILACCSNIYSFSDLLKRYGASYCVNIDDVQRRVGVVLVHNVPLSYESYEFVVHTTP